MWSIIEDTFLPDQMHHKETIFTIGNGYLSTRGVFEEGYPDECRTTFLHGVFDDVPVFTSELANAPDWLPFEVFLDGERFSLDKSTVQGYSRSLDLKTGLLTRRFKWISSSGKAVELTFERFASFADDHLMAIRCKAVSGFDGTLEFRLGFNGEVENIDVPHWRWIRQAYMDDGIITLQSETLSTKINLALAMRVITSQAPAEDNYDTKRNQPSRILTFTARQGETIIIEKYVGIATSRDSFEFLDLAVEHARAPTSWDQAFEDNRIAWQAMWDGTDILIEGDDEAQLAVRANLFQLLVAAPRHDDRVNIGAKTLSGYGYRGHSFWDTEIFMLPFFTFTAPQVARNLLNYRFQHLEAAHRKAQSNGFEGAQFPWESADTGDEVTPRWVPDFTNKNNMVRIWTGDIEIHNSADIAYGAYQYWQITGDDTWFIEKGAELILDTARFWVSRAEWDGKENHYEYNDVIGPDEYHDHIDNNFFTNYMACWNIDIALQILSWLYEKAPQKADDLSSRLKLTPTVLDSWRNVRDKIFLPVQPDGLIEQFEGYFKQTDVDLDALEPRAISAQVYFGIEGVSRTQVLKQPDVLMLMYLMRDKFDEAQIRTNYDYYTPRTDLTFGSSLGPAIQSALTCWLKDCDTAYKYFIRAANADLKDVRGNAGDGIHGASAGGIWQAVVFGFAGLKVFADRWEVNPCLPSHWKHLVFHFSFHGETQTVEIKQQD